MPVFSAVGSALSPLWALTNTFARGLLSGSAKRLPAPVISVGNIVAGGVGKTEIAALIAARLVERGDRVVVASRGYGSEWEHKGAVADELATASSLRFPDESLVILKKARGASVAVGSDRRAVLTRHWEELSPDVVVLDDGLQHFKIARDLDVVVHDFGVRWPILRDLPRQFERAHVRIAFGAVPPQWRKLEWITARYVLMGARDGNDKARALPREALAFCGLGNPDRFRKSLEAHGVKVKGFKNYRDHMAYGEEQVKELAAWSRKNGSLPLLTTLKDHVKLSRFVETQGGHPGFEPLWVEVRVELTENEALLWSAIEKVALARRR